MFLEIALIVFGAIGLLTRRNLFAIGFCFQLIFLGILLLLTQSASLKIALSLSFVFGLFMLLFATLIIFVWRNKGTLHIDEVES
ncbi:MAG: hypothetical protein JKY15_01130 [Deltaproteobacteria bacterium]|nr:hypothetical protein [Deltaproteobacteria bacterium]